VIFTSAVDDESFIEKEKTTKKTPILDTNLNININESNYVLKKQNTFWIANPAMLYIFGNTPKTNFYIFGQSILLLISAFVIIILNYYSIFIYKEKVVGLGDVPGQTWVEIITTLVTVFIIFRANNHLKYNLKKTPIKGYWVTMISNSMILSVLNQLKFTLVIFIISATYGLIKYQETSRIFSEITDGGFADNLNIFSSLAFLAITYRSFHFCKKELVK